MSDLAIQKACIKDQINRLKIDSIGQINELRRQNEELKAQLRKPDSPGMPSETTIIGLNVGGTVELMTTSSVLCDGHAKGTMLAETFNQSGLRSLTKIGEKYFIDRDGKTFTELVNYLRNRCQVYPRFESEHDEKMFQAELRFWGLKLPKEHTSVQLELSASQHITNRSSSKGYFSSNRLETPGDSRPFKGELPLESTSNMIGPIQPEESKAESPRAASFNLESEEEFALEQTPVGSNVPQSEIKVDVKQSGIVWPSQIT